MPQVDADGNEVAGIRVPEARGAAGDDDRLELPSRARRQSDDDLRAARVVRSVRANEGRARRATRSAPSIEERYRDRDDYLQRIQASAAALVKDRLLLEEDVDDVVAARDAALGRTRRATTQTN